MASYNKNFVVKNGIEVANNLIFTDSETNRVGISTSTPQRTLHVSGDAQVNDLFTNDIFANDISVNDITIQDATISGSITAGSTTGTSGKVLYSTGTGVTWSSIPIGISSISFRGNGSDVGVSSIVNFVGSGITYSTSGLGITFIFSYGENGTDPYVIYVSDYGALGDGITDDTAAIQTAVSVASTTDIPCIIRLLEKHVITSTILVSSSSITIEGAGSDMDHDIGSQGTGAKTQLIWQGSAGESMVQFESPSGASAQKKYGGGLKNIFFEADNLASIGLLIRSWNGAKFENLHFNNPTEVGIDIGVISGSLGEAKDSQDNRFIKCSSRHLETTNGTGGLLNCRGESGGSNASMNYFELMRTKIKNGDAFILNNCDNNVFLRCNVTRLSGGTGNAVVCNGSDNPEDHARGNIFIHLSATEPNTFNPVPIICRGTTSFTYPSEDNNFLFLDTDNVTPIPTIESGATAYYTTIAGYAGKTSFSNLAIGATFGDAGYALTSIASTQGLYIANKTPNHIVFDNRNNSKWIIGIDSNGKLTVTPSNTSNPVIFNSNLGLGITNPSSKLHVVGESTFVAQNTSAVVIRSGISTSYTSIDLGRDGSDCIFGVASDSGIYIGNSVAGDVVFRANSNNKLLFGSGSNNASLAISGPNVLVGSVSSTGTSAQPFQVTGGAYISGNLGIGSINPGAKLDVSGDIRLSSTNPEIEFNNGGPRITSPSTNTLAIHTGGGLNSTTNEIVRFSGIGVGIGTTIPRQSLDINGNVYLDNSASERRVIFSNGITTSYFYADQSTNRIGLYDFTNNRNLLTYNSQTNEISYDSVSKISLTPHAFDLTNSRLGVGLVNPVYGLHVYQNVANYAANITNDGNATNRQGILISCGTTNASGTNVAMVIADGDGTAQGSITFTNGTVTYGTFTANHDAILPNVDVNGYEYGTLIGFSTITYKTNSLGQPTERGILYHSQKTTQKYQKNLLGAYSGKYDNEENLHQVAVLGDGHILCCGETGNISVGDGITSSSTEGLGMKMDKPGLIIGIAQENVSFAGTESKLVAVQYGLQYYIPDEWFN